MSFDKEARNALARMVTACRKRLTEDVTDQLRGIFGLHPDGTVLALDQLAYLSEEQKVDAQALRELLDHFVAGAAGTEEERWRAAYERLVLEISFTILNRLVALRLCEERGLVIECVRKDMASDGFRLFEGLSGGALDTRYQTYHLFLESLFDELAVDLGMLFDRATPQSAIFPSERCLEDVLTLLNDANVAHLLTQDETIGWVYQYFNPPEERRAMREKSSAPRNSRDLAVRNQFFTPRYVVEFLTDNTLGRLWYEMRRGETHLKKDCRYLVRRPNEIFLDPGQQSPPAESDDKNLSQEELIKQPFYILHREKKDPRDIKVLDPACGSGHFLLYAYDAEPMPGEIDMLREFTAGLTPKVLGQLVEVVFEKMKLAGEAGSLLEIEEEIHDAVEEAKAEYQRELRQRQDEEGYLPGMVPPRDPTLFDFVDLTDDDFWNRAERDITDALEAYTRQAENGQPFQRRLFADDTAQGFALVDICRQRFDAILMNPPFGEASTRSRAYLYQSIPSSAQDLFAAFVVRGNQMLSSGGRIGAITNRLAMFKDLLQSWRLNVMLSEDFQLTTVGDLGYGVLDDAMVEAAAYVIEHQKRPSSKVKCIFFSLLDTNAKDLYLLSTITDRVQGVDSVKCFDHALENFLKLPNSIIAYWCSERWLTRFKNLPNIKRYGLVAKKGLETGDDFRYLRLVWEIPNDKTLPFHRWTYYSKDGPYRSFHADLHLAFDWTNRNLARRTSNSELYARVGLTYTERTTSNFAARILPRDALFSPAGPGIFDRVSPEPWGLLGFLNSTVASFYLELLVGGGDASAPGTAARHFSPTLLECLPVPKNFRQLLSAIEGPTRRIHSELQSFRVEETSSTYCGFQLDGTTLHECVKQRFAKYEQHVLVALELFNNIDTLVEQAYGLSNMERRDIKSYLGRPLPTNETVQESQKSKIKCLFTEASTGRNEDDPPREQIQSRAFTKLCYIADPRYESGASVLGVSPRAIASVRSENGLVPSSGIYEEAHHLMTYGVGCGLGRWDIRICRDRSLAPKLPEPFDSLSICQPGMLIGPEGLPAKPQGIVSEEWLRARLNANSLAFRGVVSRPTVSDDEYPLRISWDGILVDDPGPEGTQPHFDDIVRRVREVLDLLWGDDAEVIEQEACEILGVRDLREYFRRPTGFFDDHLKRYSKSKRKAPIYWPLSTSAGSYTVWVYYHRLTDQTLYMIVNRYVEPKIAEVERAIAGIENDMATASGRQRTQLRDRWQEARVFLAELHDFRQELLRVAGLPYKPDLNDGVIINAAPLHRLLRHRQWAKDTRDCWERLEREEYEWAHIAFTIWPERVREVCRRDCSIAIAHGLEELYEPASPSPGRRRRRQQG